MHAQLVTHAIHVMHAQQPVETSDATGAQHLLHAAATFSAMTVTHVRPAMAQHLVASKTDQLALLIAMHVRPELLTATHVRLASSKIVRPELLTATHVANVIRTSLVQPVLSAAQPLLGTRVTHAQRVTTVHRALSIATHVQHLARLTATHAQLAMATHVRQELSTETHAQLAMATRARQELSIAQNLAAHASSTTDHASLTVTTATTAPTVVQTALTV
jgi:hypothetical protein